MSSHSNVLYRNLTADPAASPAPDWYDTCRTLADLVTAALMLAVLSPVIIACMIAVKLSSKGPAIYSQTRMGRNGRHFTIYKIRTMANHCERDSGACWSTPNDARVTPLGRFLRKTHLDELPQLWNVIRGDMGLIGPRPERPEFVQDLEQTVPHYRERMTVRPGITGLAQVQLPPDTNVQSVKRKLAYDLYYVGHVGPWLDSRILLATLLKVGGVPFDKARTLLAFPAEETVEGAYEQLTAVSAPSNLMIPA